jgi:flagellin-like hook-associated protein FlgL
LLTGDANSVSAIMDTLHAAAEHLNSQLTFYGTASNTIKSAIDVASRQQVQLAASLREVRDTDLPAAALELQQATLNQQAALSAFAKRPHSSLFDFLG